MTSHASDFELAALILTRNHIPAKYTYANTISMHTAEPGKPAQLLSPGVLNSILKRLREDGDFRETVLQSLRRKHIKRYLTRWDQKTPLSEARKDRARQLVMKADAFRRKSIFPETFEVAKRDDFVRPQQQQVLQQDETLQQEHTSLAKALMDFMDKKEPPLPELNDIIETSTNEMEHEESSSESLDFLSLSKNPIVKPIYGLFRGEKHGKMYGIVATQDIAPGQLVLTWTGVDVDTETYIATLSQTCNREHLITYSIDYEADASGKKQMRTICPRLDYDGKPNIDETSYFDSSWACLVNEPMKHERMVLLKESPVTLRPYKARNNKANCRIATVSNRLVILACRKIEKHEEITMRYRDDKRYSRGKYTPGEFAPVKHCPASMNITWTEEAPDPPSDIFTRYLLPRFHSMAGHLHLKLQEELKQDDEEEDDQTFEDFIPDMQVYDWPKVEKNQDVVISKIFAYADKKTIGIKSRFAVLLFGDYESEHVLTSSMKTVQCALFTKPSLILHETLYDIWTQIATLVESPLHQLFDINLNMTDVVQHVLTQFVDVSEVKLALRQEPLIIEGLKILNNFSKKVPETEGEDVTRIVMASYRELQIRHLNGYNLLRVARERAISSCETPVPSFAFVG